MHHLTISKRCSQDNFCFLAFLVGFPTRTWLFWACFFPTLSYSCSFRWVFTTCFSQLFSHFLAFRWGFWACFSQLFLVHFALHWFFRILLFPMKFSFTCLPLGFYREILPTFFVFLTLRWISLASTSHASH